MNVLLLAPPISAHPTGIYPRHPPLLLASVAGSLEAEGAQVRVLDAFAQDLSAEQAVERVARFSPDLVVILPNDVARETPPEITAIVADGIRRRVPAATVLVAAVGQPRWLMSLLGNTPALDGALCGDPEEPVLEAYRLLGRNLDWRLASGAMYRGMPPEDVHIHVTQDLDSLARPAWGLVGLKSYTVLAHRQRLGPEYPILASRGCFWNRCGFCQDLACVKSADYRVRLPESVVLEMAEAHRSLGASHFLFHDAVFPPQEAWLTEFADQLERRGLDITWFCMARADSVTPDGLKTMARAGCVNICFGLESGSDRMLSAMDKGHDLAQSRQAVQWARLAGIEVSATFILGFPGESAATARQTVEFAIELDIDYAQFMLVKWHQVPSHLLAQGTLYKDWDLTQFDYRGMLFVPHAVGTPERLKLLRTYAWLRFYARPAYLLGRARQIRNTAELRRYLSGAKTLLGAVLNR